MKIYPVVALFAVAATLFATVTTTAQDKKKPVGKPAKAPKEITTKSGLKYIEVKVGKGVAAKSGDKVFVHYTGYLTNGTKFDSSIGKSPLDFVIDNSNIIPGWQEGLKGMKVGGKRKLTIPPALAYGKSGFPPVIPPDATIIFDVELMSIGK